MSPELGNLPLEMFLFSVMPPWLQVTVGFKIWAQHDSLGSATWWITVGQQGTVCHPLCDCFRTPECTTIYLEQLSVEKRSNAVLLPQQKGEPSLRLFWWWSSVHTYMHTDKGVANALLLRELHCLNRINRYSISSFFKVFCSHLDFLPPADCLFAWDRVKWIWASLLQAVF